MSGLDVLTNQIMDEIADMTATVDQFELGDQPGAAEKLPGILEKARELSAALNDLCNCDHLPVSTTTLEAAKGKTEGELEARYFGTRALDRGSGGPEDGEGGAL